MEQINERNVLIRVAEEDYSAKDVILQFEMALTLLGKLDLLGVVTSLILIAQIGYTFFRTQKQLAKRIGISEPTFIQRIKELKQLGFIEIKDEGNHRILNLKFLSRLKFFKLPSSASQQDDYIDRTVKFIVSNTLKEDKQLSLSDNMYYINTINNKNKLINNNKLIKHNSVKGKGTNGRTFPKEDYGLVLDAFKKYKGVSLAGPEISYHLRAIKFMFLAERKPKEIIEFMKWLHDHENDETTSWVKTWTIWTVQKKISEFVAGKLRGEKTTEEAFAAYGHAPKQY